LTKQRVLAGRAEKEEKLQAEFERKRAKRDRMLAKVYHI